MAWSARLRFPFKYNGIRLPRRVPGWVLAPQDLAQVDFDLRRLGPNGFIGRKRQAAGHWLMRGALRLLQRFWPRCRIGNLLILTRHADVTLALHRPEIFANHYEPEMRLIANGYRPDAEMSAAEATFMLAIDGEQAHKGQHEPVAKALSNPPLIDAFRSTSNLVCDALLRNGGGRIDVMKDYFTRVAAEAGVELLGLEIDDPDSFADWTLAVSTMIFGDPFGRPVVRELAQYAGWRLRASADRAIHIARHKRAKGKRQASLVTLLLDDGRLEDEEIRAILIGTAIGLVPTVTLAAGNIIEWLLKHPETMASAREAAKAEDGAKLRRIIEEVARLRPALDPGQFRFVDRDIDYTLPSGRVRIPAGTVALVSTAQALSDPRAYPDPGKFTLDRPPSQPSLMFGAGMHGCLGWDLALEQMTVMFRHLLSKEDIRPVKGRLGRVERVGPFPRRLDLRYGPPGEGRDASQSMITIAIPVGETDLEFAEDLAARISRLGNPAELPMKSALEDTGIVHFCSLSLLDVGKPRAPDWRLILEISADGEESVAIEKIAGIALPDFRQIFQAVGHERGDESLAEFLARHRLDVRPYPWGATGLLYNGSAGFSVETKRDQADLAAFASKAMQYHMQNPDRVRNERIGDVRPIGMIRFIRDLLLIDEVGVIRSRLASGHYSVPISDGGLGDLHREARTLGLRHMLFLPSRERLPFLEWRQLGLGSKIRRYLASPSMAGIVCAVLLAVVALGSLIWLGLANGVASASAERTAGVAKLLFAVSVVAALLEARGRRKADRKNRRPSLGDVAAAFVAAGLATLAFVPSAAAAAAKPASIAGAVVAVALLAVLVFLSLFGLAWSAAFLWLRRLEERDRPDERDPDLRLRREIAERENAPGFEQNHLLSCSDFKPGILRRFTFALAMWGIGLFCRYWTRPGFILSMGTIHFARWLRLPGAAKLVFMSNYDGSWESYLEDFITKAHPGQTAAWCHGEGFPRTRALTREGARNGDRFKRWVRRQQRVTHFWYSRFPELTLDRVRTNGLIHEGLARAATDTRAREWLALFGSLQRPEAMIETSEVQTFLFRGLPDKPQGAYLFVDLGPNPRAVLQRLITAEDFTRASDLRTVTFGELLPGTTHYGPVLALGLTAKALRKLQLPGEEEADGLASFPLPFLDGMAKRTRVLGDRPTGWNWNDGQCDAVLILLANEPGDFDRNGNPVADSTVELPATEEESHQPPARARGRATAPAALGHRHPEIEDPGPPNAEEYLDRAVRDLTAFIAGKGGLIVKEVRTQPVRLTHEGKRKRSRFRDHFGFRDGLSQPAIRGTFAARRAAPNDIVEPGEFILGYRSNQGYVAPSLRLRVDLDPDDLLPDTSTEPNGAFPAFRQGEARATPFRDFGRNGSFMVIRQMNQDVKQFEKDARKMAKEIRDRYKGLRGAIHQAITADWVKAKIVGRWPDGTPLIDRSDQPKRGLRGARNDFSFAKDDPRGLGCPLGAHVRRANPRDSLDWDDPRAIAIANRHRLLRRGRHYDQDCKKGLMFTAICGDIERQFEFVMQRWLGGRSFHGLNGETDPLTTSGPFTIPTVVGPVKIDIEKQWVETVGGGYFFLPSRAALRYLADAHRPAPRPTPAPASEETPVGE